MASVVVAQTASTRAGRRFPLLLGSRVFEQCVLGGASLVLAARVGTVAFAPIAALFVINAAAVTLSDYGVGLAVLRCAPDELVAARVRTGMRAANVSLMVVGLILGPFVGGDIGLLVAAGVVIWWSSAEAFVAKAASINHGVGQRAALAEIVGSAAFGAAVLALGFGSRALLITCIAFPLKHVLEALIAHRPAVFGQAGSRPDLAALWGTQALAFGVANVDYLVVAVLLGASAFSIYTIAYRFAVAVPSMVAYVASRTLIADLSGSDTNEIRHARYLHYLERLFALGVLAAVVMSAGAFLVPSLLGAQWAAVAPTVAVLAVAVPWRMAYGQAGALAVALRQAGFVVKWGAVQLTCFAVVFAVAASFDYSTFVTVSAIAWIVAVTWFERGVAAKVAIAGWRWLPRLAVVGVSVALVAGMGLHP
jgi:hypothetical protein